MIQLGVASERVGLRHTNERGERLLRMLAVSIRCIGQPDRWRLVRTARPIVARVDLETIGLCGAVPGHQRRQRRVIRVELAAS